MKYLAIILSFLVANSVLSDPYCADQPNRDTSFIGLSGFALDDSPWSVSMWVRPDTAATDGHHRFFTKFDGSGNYCLIMAVNSVFVIFASGSQPNPGAVSYTVGLWYHFVYVQTVTNGAFFLNGTVASSADGSLIDWPASSGETCFLGNSAETASLYGRIDEVVLEQRAFSQAEIDELYASGDGLYAEVGKSPCDHSTTIGIWHFDEGAGLLAADSSGNNHIATNNYEESIGWAASTHALAPAAALVKLCGKTISKFCGVAVNKVMGK